MPRRRLCHGAACSATRPCQIGRDEAGVGFLQEHRLSYLFAKTPVQLGKQCLVVAFATAQLVVPLAHVRSEGMKLAWVFCRNIVLVICLPKRPFSSVNNASSSPLPRRSL